MWIIKWTVIEWRILQNFRDSYLIVEYFFSWKIDFCMIRHQVLKLFKHRNCLKTAVACRKGHQGIQSIPKILSSSSPCSLLSHVSIIKSVACIPRYFCYGPPLQNSGTDFFFSNSISRYLYSDLNTRWIINGVHITRANYLVCGVISNY